MVLTRDIKAQGNDLIIEWGQSIMYFITFKWVNNHFVLTFYSLLRSVKLIIFYYKKKYLKVLYFAIHNCNSILIAVLKLSNLLFYLLLFSKI